MRPEHKCIEICKIIICEAQKKIEDGKIIKRMGENLIALKNKTGWEKNILEKIEREGEREIFIGKQIVREGMMLKEEGEDRIRLGKNLEKVKGKPYFWILVAI